MLVSGSLNNCQETAAETVGVADHRIDVVCFDLSKDLGGLPCICCQWLFDEKVMTMLNG